MGDFLCMESRRIGVIFSMVERRRFVFSVYFGVSFCVEGLFRGFFTDSR